MFEKASVMLGVWGKALEAEGTANVVAWRQEGCSEEQQGAMWLDYGWMRGRMGGGDHEEVCSGPRSVSGFN